MKVPRYIIAPEKLQLLLSSSNYVAVLGKHRWKFCPFCDHAIREGKFLGFRHSCIKNG